MHSPLYEKSTVHVHIERIELAVMFNRMTYMLNATVQQDGKPYHEPYVSFYIAFNPHNQRVSLLKQQASDLYGSCGVNVLETMRTLNRDMRFYDLNIQPFDDEPMIDTHEIITTFSKPARKECERILFVYYLLREQQENAYRKGYSLTYDLLHHHYNVAPLSEYHAFINSHFIEQYLIQLHPAGERAPVKLVTPHTDTSKTWQEEVDDLLLAYKKSDPAGKKRIEETLDKLSQQYANMTKLYETRK